MDKSANIPPHERFKDYTSEVCWQRHIREENFYQDLAEYNLTEEEVASLRISDFEFEYVDKTDKSKCDEITEFIHRHEWLGKMPARPTHRFTARYNGILAGVVIMATPNTFSYLLGKENKNIEKLISRGACISWSPKNLGSWLIMNSIRWMAANTEFRIFTAYSDPEAKELGTIYQACNFMYLGQKSGTLKQYFDPACPEKGWFSDRNFRHRSNYMKYAQRVGISKDQMKKWYGKYSPDWSIIPPNIKDRIKAEEKAYKESCQERVVPTKHKYAYILGANKIETKILKKKFAALNPKMANLPYPTERGK